MGITCTFVLKDHVIHHQGFVCLCAVTKGSAADRAGLRELFEKSAETGHMVVISRLQGKSVMPTLVSSDSLLHCCDHGDIKETLIGAVDQLETIRLHLMALPSTTLSGSTTPSVGVATLRPPL